MSSIGSRFLYYRIPQLTEEERNEGFTVTWGGGEERKKHQADLRRLALEHIADVRALPHIWTPETQEQQHFLQCLAKFVAHGRGAITWQRSPFGDYEVASVQVEEPFRALQQLRNLARALARVHGRTALTDHELELVRRVALSTLPSDRKAVLDLFQRHLEGVTASMCAKGLEKSDDRARSLLNELVRVGLVITEEEAAPQGRPLTRYSLAPQFADIVIREDKPVDHLLDLSLDGLFRQNSPQEVEPIIY